ncbi:MAG: DUF4382 domain-containing protein [Dehalococcoidales bacterium]|nr:DUF4382 domain-containing protein [Dehalococcoidales bacterium]
MADSANYRVLVSDEKNAIDDFKNLFVTVTKIGIQTAADSENWTQITPAITTFDLKLLIGENATPLWSGNVTRGKYEKVFIYISEVSGVLASATDNKSVTVRLPGGKLQISKPFTISENTTTNFVFDITVIKTGSDKYILKPEVEMSGADQKIKEVKAGAERQDKAKSGILLRIDGKAEPAAEVTLLATSGKKSPLAGATISMDGTNIGTTGADGKLKIILPDEPGEVKISAVSGNITGELELELRAIKSKTKSG